MLVTESTQLQRSAEEHLDLEAFSEFTGLEMLDEVVQCAIICRPQSLHTQLQEALHQALFPAQVCAQDLLQAHNA